MEDKALLRQWVLAERARRSAAARARAAEALARHGLAAWSGCQVVAAYAGVGVEPPTRPLLDGLSAAGVQVLLPVARPGGELDWGRYDGWDRLAAGAVGGLLEPGTVAGPAALSAAEVIVVPALAADPHGGRLGRGAGYYDRALAGLTAPTLAVVFDDEVLTSVPVEAHDVAMSGVLTPSGLRWW